MVNIFYWGVYLIIILFQAFYTFSTNGLRLEEVVESFRSPWWFQNQLVWNGGYTFLGWSFLQVLAAQIFGFSVYNPKFIKLFIEIIGYFCLAKMLKKNLSAKIAWLPLLTIGLSPAFLYFNSLQLSMGTEVSFFLICLYILTTLDFNPPSPRLRRDFSAHGGSFKNKKEAMLKQGLLWGIAMLAWLTYFGFIFYLPILGVFYLYLLWRNNKKYILKNLILSFFVFLLPLIAMFFYIKNRELLIYDPLLQRGLFRSFSKVEAKPEVWFDTFQRLTKDLFIEPSSYYFESKKVEFSDYYPLISLAAVGGVLVVVFKKKKRVRPIILSLTIFLLTYYFLVSVIGPITLGGMRRGTVLLVLFYILFTIAWQFLLSQKTKSILQFTLIGSFCLLPMHHLIVYPVNIENIKKPSVFRERWWFNSDHPDKTLSDLVAKLKVRDLVFSCEERQGKPFQCPGLSLIYPALAASCYWNNLYCHKIIFYDEVLKKNQVLTLEYWGTSSHTEP